MRILGVNRVTMSQQCALVAKKVTKWCHLCWSTVDQQLTSGWPMVHHEPAECPVAKKTNGTLECASGGKKVEGIWAVLAGICRAGGRRRGARLVPSDRGNRMEHWEIHLNARQNCAVEVVEPWHKVPREVRESPSLIQTHLDAFQCNLL